MVIFLVESKICWKDVRDFACSQRRCGKVLMNKQRIQFSNANGDPILSIE